MSHYEKIGSFADFQAGNPQMDFSEYDKLLTINKALTAHIIGKTIAELEDLSPEAVEELLLAKQG